jgi:hypothetical protein
MIVVLQVSQGVARERCTTYGNQSSAVSSHLWCICGDMAQNSGNCSSSKPVEVGPRQVIQGILTRGDGASHNLSIQVVRQLQRQQQQQHFPPCSTAEGCCNRPGTVMFMACLSGRTLLAAVNAALMCCCWGVTEGAPRCVHSSHSP